MVRSNYEVFIWILQIYNKLYNKYCAIFRLGIYIVAALFHDQVWNAHTNAASEHVQRLRAHSCFALFIH